MVLHTPVHVHSWTSNSILECHSLLYISSTDMAQGTGYQPPEGFTFSKPEGWPSWIRRLENYRIASKLDLEDEKRQASSLSYAMGEKEDDILQSFRLSDDNW